MRKLLLVLILLVSVAYAQPAEDDFRVVLMVARLGDYEGAARGLAVVKENPAVSRADMIPLLEVYLEAQQADADAAARLALEAAKRSHELELKLLALSYLEIAGRPKEVEAHLPRVNELAAAAPGARGQLARYLAASFQARADFRARRPTPEELAQRAEQAAHYLQGFQPDADLIERELVEYPLVADAALDWHEMLLRRGNVQAASQHLEKVIVPTLVQFDPALGHALDVSGVGMHSSLPILGLAAVATERIHEVTGVEASVALADVEDSLAVFDQLEKTWEDPTLHWLQDSGRRGWTGISRVRTNTAGVGILITESRRRALTEDERHQARLYDAAAYTALQGPGQERVGPDLWWRQATYHWAYLWSIRPENWQRELAFNLDGNERFLREKPALRFYLSTLLSYRGNLLAEEKQTTPAIEALKERIAILETYVQEAGAGAGVDVAERIRPDYELLARLLLEAGRPAEAAAVLDRQKQLATIATITLRDLADQKPELREAAALQARMASPEATANERSRFYQALDRLQRQEPTYLRLQVRPNNFSRVQKHLPADTLLVQLFPSQETLYLFVATRDSLKIHEVPVGKQKLEQLVTAFRQQVSAVARGGSGEGYREATAGLGAAILPPLEADLKGKSVIAFIPTGVLHYFPLQALARADGRMLIEDHAVVVLAKASDLDVLDRPAPQAAIRLVALADPDGSLPAAREEVRQLKDLFGDARVWEGGEARADRLAQLGAEPLYLHLATHGNLDARTPTESFLLVSGEPARLTVTEIAGLDLSSARMVTLSACQSALADRAPEVGMEITSLADAFGFAGSPTLVASLWKVSDTATRDLMTEFYKQLKAGATGAEALRQAQLKLLRTPATSHPFYWSGFVLMGDWR